MTAAITDHVDRFRTLIASHMGLQFDDAKVELLGEVLHRRSRARAQSPASYLARLATAAADELRALAEELTVGETYFFRNRDQFTAFVDVSLRDRMRIQRDRRKLRILSAGCASGEEAYSIAIVMRDVLPDASWEAEIRGVDLNPAALRRAANGRFSSWALRETPMSLRQAWFREEGREFVLDDRVRRAVRFEERNLAADDHDLWQQDAFDVIFCRNVLMYFTPEVARQVVARIECALARGGYLFLGHAETLRGLSQQFHLRHTHGTFYYQRREHDAPVTAVSTAKAWEQPPALGTVDGGSATWIDTIERAADRIRALADRPATPVSTTAAANPSWDLGHALDLLRRERFGDALAVVEGLPSDSARDPDALLLHAVLLTHSGRLGDAENTCRRLLEFGELDAGAHYVLALCREGAGDAKGALDHDQVAVYLDPTFAMPRLHLGLLARRAGDRDAARRELSQALLLLGREDASRLLLFGGGFHRQALIALCRAELAATENRS